MNENYAWYEQLKKPSWAPPKWLFGPVWTLLYVGIAISFGGVFLQVFKGALPWTVAIPFVLNLVFNVAYTPIQFRLKNNMLALLDVLAVLGSLIWALLAVFPAMPWVAFVNLPYWAWVTFATVLQATITYMNRKTS